MLDVDRGAYEITREEDFDVLDESIRGEVPPGCFKQVTLTFNPWNERHWLKRRFFDAPETPEILAMTTNYLCNEWLDEADKRVFAEMKARNPRRYRVAGLGDWGIVDGLVYENFREMDFNVRAEEFQRLHPRLHSCCGLDFGFTNDPTAAFIGFVDTDTRQIFVWDELYEKALSNRRIAQRLTEMLRQGELHRGLRQPQGHRRVAERVSPARARIEQGRGQRAARRAVDSRL